MAFRKSSYGVYRAPIDNIASFAEIETVQQPNADGGLDVLFSPVSPAVVAKRALDPNLFTADNLVKSGKVINGSTSMAPTDPDNIERRVERGLRSYIANNPVSSSNNE